MTTLLLPPPPALPAPDCAAHVRHDLVARVRRKIASGRYPTRRMLDIALDRLIEDATGRRETGHSPVDPAAH